MTTKKSTSNKRVARTSQAPRTTAAGGPRGDMRPGEIRPLACQALKAFDYQQALGNIEDGVTFDAWRHQQVMAVVNKPGLSALNHGDFKPVLAHFQLLAGRDDVALGNFLGSGRVKDHGDPTDTHELRAQKVHLIREALRAHTGPIREGYVLAIARNKFGIQPRGLDDLVGRLTAKQLDQLLFTTINRINAKEGTGFPTDRNKSQSKRASAESRSRTKGDVGPTPRF